MAMSRKDYAAVAAGIKQAVTNSAHFRDGSIDPWQDATAVRVCNALVQVFQADNPRFDAPTFITACGF